MMLRYCQKLLNSLCSSKLFCLLIVCTGTLDAHRIRVLLAEGELTQDNRWEILTEHGFNVRDYHHPETEYALQAASAVLDTVSGKLRCNGKKVTTQALEIVPENDRYEYQGKPHEGHIVLIIEKGHWFLITSVDLEQYVYSVLRWESWPGWPLEVNKVFALMIRTYAVEKIAQRAKDNPVLFDIRATNAHQTYKGTHDSPTLRSAVEETKGVIIAYNKFPIVAMYDSCCGGIIPAKSVSVNGKKHPYLARSYPCTYCASCKLYSWKVVYGHDVFVELMREQFPNLKTVKDIKVTYADKAGLVQEILLKTPHGNRTLTGRKLYNLCKDIKSFCYSLKKSGTEIIVEGKGFGHHMGLCQWGTREMVKQGFLCRDIIDFYYPGTHLMRLISSTEYEVQHAEL